MKKTKNKLGIIKIFLEFCLVHKYLTKQFGKI